MKRFFSRIKSQMGANPSESEENEDGYVELSSDYDKSEDKVVVRSFNLKDFEEMKGILDVLRKGNTICLINIKPLKDKDLPELKRAINKLKKTTDAIEGEIAGFGEEWVVAVPPFATIHKSKQDTLPTGDEQEL